MPYVNTLTIGDMKRLGLFDDIPYKKCKDLVLTDPFVEDTNDLREYVKITDVPTTDKRKCKVLFDFDIDEENFSILKVYKTTSKESELLDDLRYETDSDDDETDSDDDETEYEQWDWFYGTSGADITKRYIMSGGGDHWWDYEVHYDVNTGEQKRVYIVSKTGRQEQNGKLYIDGEGSRLYLGDEPPSDGRSWKELVHPV